MMKQILIALISLMSGTVVVAQNSISGRIVNVDGEGVPFANVMLLSQSDSSLIAGTTSSDIGQFTLNYLENSVYRLSISCIGFKTTDRIIDIATIPKTMDFMIEKHSEEIDEITVSAKRIIFKREIDRLVFDVEHSANATNGDALDLLNVTPGVRVQNEKVTMLGKNTVAIMVNEKVMRLPQEELAGFLKSIPSEEIASIEVITTPPAKYEANGNSGIIHIRLKKLQQDSWKAVTRVTHAKRSFGNTFANGILNFNKNKLSLAASLFVNQGTYRQEQDDYAYFPDGIWYTASPFNAERDGLNARLEVTYEINPVWTIGAQVQHNEATFVATDSPYTPVYDYETAQITRALNTKSIAELKPNFNAYNLYNKFELDTNGSKIIFNVDLFSFNKTDDKFYIGESKIEQPLFIQTYTGTNNNAQNVQNFSAAIDAEFPTTVAKFEIGGKLSFSDSRNEIQAYNSGLTETIISDQILANTKFDYNENVQALYVSAKKSLNPKWESQLGFRLESTQTKSRTNGSEVETSRNYLKLFPSIHLAFSPNENNTYSFSYSRRIQRPGFWSLNPNIYFVNPFQTIEGNPFLQPSFTDNVELLHSYKNLSSRIYFSNENNLFAQVPLANANGNFIRFTNENYIDTKRFGITENISLNPLKWWSSFNRFDLNYSRSTFNLAQAYDPQKGINTRFSTNNNFSLNKEKTLSLNINYWYSTPGVYGIFDIQSMSSLSFSIQTQLLNKKLNIAIKGTDLLKQEAENLQTTINDVYQTAIYYYDSRSIQLSVSYSFGNQNISAKRHQSGNTAEKSRTGN